ncbi:MAG: hypothetical protein HYZ47_05310 [Simkania negevensis]|nr:hypothetical protein [Simkania negevensis]
MKIIAHRGASMEAPENTKSSITKAIELGAPIIEVDIRMTKDKVAVIVHDPEIEKEGKSYHIKDLDLSELRTFDVGGWFLNKFKGEKILTLEEMLQLDYKGSALMLEIKWMGAPFIQDVEQVMHTIHTQGKNQKFFIATQSLPVLSYLKKKHPSCTLIAIIHSEPEVEEFLKVEPKLMALRHQLLTKERVAFLHERGIEIWGWTIDDLAYGKELKRLGVDGIITNNAASFLKAFVSNKKQRRAA